MARALGRMLAVAVPFMMLMVGLPAAAPAAEASSTVVTMFSDTGDWVGSGASRIWRPGAGSVSLTGSTESGWVRVTVEGGASGGPFTMLFNAPTGQTLTTGDYENALRTRTAGNPGIDISGDGRGCNETAGRFSVRDVAPDLSRLWLVYEQHCEGGDPASFGEIRYNVPGGDSDLLVAPGQIAWPAEYPGVSGRLVPVTLVNTGLAPVTVSGLSIDDGDADFSIQNNTCSTVAVGASCAVYVRFTPSTTGERRGTLRIADSTAAGSHTVALSGRGIPGHTSWAMRSQAGDWVGSGKDWSYSPANSTITAGGNESQVDVQVSQGTNRWSARFRADGSRLLLPGTTFTNATRFGTTASPGLDVSGMGHGCNTVTGSFTIHEAVYEGGVLQKFSATFEQHCEGATPALFGSIVWKADNPAQPLPDHQPTSVTVDTDRARYAYGETATVVADLGPTAPATTDRTVTIYATPYGGTRRLLTTAVVGSDGRVTVTRRVYKRTTFTVEYAGDEFSDGASDNRVVTVRADVANYMGGHHRIDRGVYLYHVQRHPKLYAEVRPGHAGDCLYFRAQRLASGTWKALTVSSCIRIDADSWAGVVLTGTQRVGDRIRMRAEWRGDTENLADLGSWRYARFTR